MKGEGRVALVLVSHSSQVAAGTRELAAAMAPAVHIGACGGNPDGGLGTSFDLVESAVAEASLAGAGVVVITDLGSATMTAEAVIELLDEPQSVRLAPGPFVEGAVAAAVAAEGGGDLDSIAAAVSLAASMLAAEASAQAPSDAPDSGSDASGGTTFTATAVVADSNGLHARPAAEVARIAGAMPCEIRIDGADAASILEVMSLKAVKGQQVTITASGENAEQSVRELAAAIAAGFDAEPH